VKSHPSSLSMVARLGHVLGRKSRKRLLFAATAGSGSVLRLPAGTGKATPSEKLTAQAGAACSSRHGMKFIAGEDKGPPQKRQWVVIKFVGSTDMPMRANCSWTKTRSASVIASTGVPSHYKR